MNLPRKLYPMKCILAGASGFGSRSIVFGTLVHFWTLWLFGSLYVGLDRLICYTLVYEGGHKKECPKLYQCDFQHGT